MKVARLPNPSRNAKPLLTSLEPWQIEGLRVVRETYGVDGDALIRAGLTVMLGLIAAVPHHAVARVSEQQPCNARSGAGVEGAEHG